MRTISAVAQEFNSSGLRLDASYYASSGVQATLKLEKWRKANKQNRIEKLHEVCVPKGYFIPSRFKRVYITDKRHGAPYLTGGNILQVDPLEGARLLSRKYTANWDELIFQERMTLLTCSGTIGNAVYVNKDLLTSIGSPDLLRIVADPEKILPGYLFTVLSSSIGKALIQQKTYGAVIPHIESHHVKDLPIPRLGQTTEQKIHALIEQSAKLRVHANQFKQKAEKETSKLLGIQLDNFQPRKYAAVKLSKLNDRFEATYHTASSVEDLFKRANYPLVELRGLLENIFYLGKLHRVFVDDSKYGVPLLSISDVQNAKLDSNKFISKTLSRNVNDAMLQKGCILISRSGTPGIVTLVRSEMIGMAGTDHLIRLFPNESKLLNGYLFSFLTSSVGKSLLTRSVHGSVQLTLPPEYVSQIKLPLPPIESQKPVHDLIEQYGDALSEASKLEDQAQNILAKALQT